MVKMRERFLVRRDHLVLLESVRHDRENRFSYLFGEPFSVLEARDNAGLYELFGKVEDLVKKGNYAVGFISYEAGYALEESFGNRRESLSFPLARFYIYEESEVFICPVGLFRKKWALEEKDLSNNFSIENLFFNVMPEEYNEKIRQIKELIAEGETYQVNYTLKCKFHFSGDPSALYLQLRKRQPVPYAAFFRDGNFALLSFSPELFFRKDGDRITVRPMKGTIARGKNIFQDRWNAWFLQQNLKDRAENVMIVDLLRNDLGKISRIGSIRVPSLFDVEKHPTLFQMTSTILARLKEELSLWELFRAIFPSGSVTGAPKIRTMKIIRQLEKEPRNVYTGAVGFFLPGGRAVFNVAIRTILISGSEGEMGVGSGIVFDSDPEKEYQECRLKARFLTSSVV